MHERGVGKSLALAGTSSSASQHVYDKDAIRKAKGKTPCIMYAANKSKRNMRQKKQMESTAHHAADSRRRGKQVEAQEQLFRVSPH